MVPIFSSTASWWGLRLFFHGSIGDAILHTLLVHILFAEKGNLENACLCSLFFWLESSLLFTWDFFIFQAKMGAHFGWKQKIFHRANSFSFRKEVFFSLLGRSFRWEAILLNLSLLKCYSTVNCEVVMTDFAIWVNMKNARFCNVFDRFCKIFFAQLPYLCSQENNAHVGAETEG